MRKIYLIMFTTYYRELFCSFSVSNITQTDRNALQNKGFLKVLILLTLPPKPWHQRRVPQHQMYALLGIRHRHLRMSHKNFTNWDCPDLQDMYRQAYKIVILPIDIDTKETKGICWIHQQRWEILNDLSLHHPCDKQDMCVPWIHPLKWC